MERIVSVIERPQMLYVVSPNMFASLGNVVFNEHGEPLGMLSLRYARGRSRSGSSDYVPVVIPAADVWEIAQQAPQVKDVKDTETTSKSPSKKPSGRTTPHPTAPTRPVAPPKITPPAKGQPGKKPAAKK